MADADLIRVLAEIQRRGAIGGTSLVDAIAHSDRFVSAVPEQARTVVDLGSGGGLPGLVIAHRRRDVHVTLIERRAKRVDLLRYGVRALGLVDTVTVHDGDALTYAVELLGDLGRRCDVVTARSYGPLPVVLDTAATMLVPGGTALVDAAPGGASAEPHGSFEDLGMMAGIHRFRMFHVEHRGHDTPS